MIKGSKFILYYLIYLLGLSLTAFGHPCRTLQTLNFSTDTIPLDSTLDVVKITRSWELPPALKKISGIDFIDETRAACIQDEVGAIFIYNIQTESIEAEIPFATPGDYEGIALAGKNAYIAAADGRILEVANFRSAKPSVREFGTHLTVRQNVEGICYDKKNRRLLVVIKGQEESSQYYKDIYAFDLASKKMRVKPVFRIDLQDTVLNKGHSKKFQSLLLPSDIDIHPRTGDLYITDAVKSQILLLDATGAVKSLHHFSRAKTIQPEGVSITPSGLLYIASEGFKEDAGKLLLVVLETAD